LLLYNSLFSCSKSVKNLLSLSKYSNVIQFSDFSNVQNLTDKYVNKNIFDRLIYYILADKVLNVFNNNIKECFSIRDDTNLRMKMKQKKFKSLYGRCLNMDLLIESNTFYTYAFKNTTNIGHDYKLFLKTIEANNDLLKQTLDDEKKYFVKNIEEIDFKHKQVCLDSLRVSVDLFKKELLDNSFSVKKSESDLVNYIKRRIIKKL